MDFEQKNIIGIDIGSSQIKIINMDKNGRPKGKAIVPISDGQEINQRASSEDLLARKIMETIKKSKIRGKRCSLCLPSHNLVSKVILLPKMDTDVLKENIYYDMEDYLPLGLENYIIDFITINTSQLKGVQYYHILVTAILKEISLSYFRILKKAGLRPVYFDIPSNALQKLLMSLPCLNRQLTLIDSNICLIDAGANYTNIIIFNRGNYFVDKTISLGVKDITSEIENNSEAKIYMRQVTSEVKEVIRYFKNHISKDSRLDNIILLGGGSTLVGFSEYLRNETGIDVNLLSIWTDTIFKDFSKEEFVLMAKAIGSTIRRN